MKYWACEDTRISTENPSLVVTLGEIQMQSWRDPPKVSLWEGMERCQPEPRPAGRLRC